MILDVLEVVAVATGDPGDFVSVHSMGFEVVCFDTVLQLFILDELGTSVSVE